MDCKTCIHCNKFSANKTLNLRMINIVETFGLIVTSSFYQKKNPYNLKHGTKFNHIGKNSLLVVTSLMLYKSPQS